MKYAPVELILQGWWILTTSKYLLDTTICVLLLRNKNNLAQHLESIGGFDTCAISEITVAELLYGVEKSLKVEENRKATSDFLDKLFVLPISPILGIYAKEKARLEKIGYRVEDLDLLIGCTALNSQLIMVTDNVKHFNRINGLQIENWCETVG
jgi:tRNA(fMet)-specific endonuclease VapC